MTRRKPPNDRLRRHLHGLPGPCPDCASDFVGREMRHEPTCPASAALDAVTDDDARYFEEHPGEMLRVPPISHAEILEWAHIDGVRVPDDCRIVDQFGIARPVVAEGEMASEVAQRRGRGLRLAGHR